jgi:hypothetical protein
MKQAIALTLCAVFAAQGCASTSGIRVQSAPTAQTSSDDRLVFSEFANQLELGSRVKVTLTGNRVVKGTLVKRTDDAMVIQPRTRVAEPLVTVSYNDLVALEQDLPSSSSGSTGRTIAIGAGIGAGAAVGVILILAAVFAGS